MLKNRPRTLHASFSAPLRPILQVTIFQSNIKLDRMSRCIIAGASSVDIKGSVRELCLRRRDLPRDSFSTAPAKKRGGTQVAGKVCWIAAKMNS